MVVGGADPAAAAVHDAAVSVMAGGWVIDLVHTSLLDSSSHLSHFEQLDILFMSRTEFS